MKGPTEIGYVFSIFHDGCVSSASMSGGAGQMVVQIAYLAGLATPGGHSFTIRFQGLRRIAFIPWQEEGQPALPPVTALADIAALELGILSAESEGDTVRIACTHDRPEATFTGGTLEIIASACRVHDDANREWTLPELAELASRYWTESESGTSEAAPTPEPSPPQAQPEIPQETLQETPPEAKAALAAPPTEPLPPPRAPPDPTPSPLAPSPAGPEAEEEADQPDDPEQQDDPDETNEPDITWRDFFRSRLWLLIIGMGFGFAAFGAATAVATIGFLMSQNPDTGRFEFIPTTYAPWILVAGILMTIHSSAILIAFWVAWGRYVAGRDERPPMILAAYLLLPVFFPIAAIYASYTIRKLCIPHKVRRKVRRSWQE